MTVGRPSHHGTTGSLFANRGLRCGSGKNRGAHTKGSRARNRLGKFLLCQGRRAAEVTKAWTGKYLKWIKEQVHFEQPAQEATLLDYLHEVEHAGERIQRLEKSIDTAIETVPQKMRAVIQGLQSLRGIAKVSAVSIVAELGEISRFAKPVQLMGYSGAVSREHTSGERIIDYEDPVFNCTKVLTMPLCLVGSGILFMEF